MIKSAKEARETLQESHKIYGHYWDGPTPEQWSLICLAKGFLEALKGPEVQALVEALENCAKWYRFKGQDGASDVNGLDGLRLAQGVAEKALAKFKREVGE